MERGPLERQIEETVSIQLPEGQMSTNEFVLALATYIEQVYNAVKLLAREIDNLNRATPPPAAE